MKTAPKKSTPKNKTERGIMWKYRHEIRKLVEEYKEKKLDGKII
jgi:hypothetical protein